MLWTFIMFATLVGSVHSVECGRDPWWPSTLWTCIILWTGWVRPLYVLGFWTLVGSVLFFWSYISLTLVGSVHFLDLYKFGPGWVRPLCGLISLTLGGIRPLCGLVSLTLVGSVHFVDRVDPWWDPSTLWTCKFDPGWVRPLCGPCWPLVGSVHFVVIILVARTQHGLECSFIRFKAVEKSTCPRGLKKNNTKRAIVTRACSYKKPKTIKRLVNASRNN